MRLGPETVSQVTLAELSSACLHSGVGKVSPLISNWSFCSLNRNTLFGLLYRRTA